MIANVERWRGRRADRGVLAEPVLFRLAAAFFVIALVFGGGGARYHLLTLLIESAGIVLLWFAVIRRGSRVLAPDRLANTILGLALALPIVQLVSLPYDTWTGLPGRAIYAAALDAAGLSGQPQPISLHAYATWSSLLALLPAAALFLVASRLSGQEQIRLLHLLLVVAVVSAILGIVQKSSGGAGIAALFPSAHSPHGPGLFANRNHQAALMNLCIPVAAGVLTAQPLARASWGRTLALAAMILFAGAVVATTSRMGLAVLPVALIAALLIMFPISRANVRRNIALGLVGLVAAGAAALQSSGVQAVLQRFAGTEIRLEYWADTALAIEAFWPLGSGFGTFQDVFQAFENLNSVNPAFPFNAHNDYLEMALEGGAPALALLALFFVWLALRTKSLAAPAREERRPLIGVALAAILVLLLHSIVDYPLRTFTLMTAFSLMCAILASAHGSAHGPARAGRERLGVRARG